MMYLICVPCESAQEDCKSLQLNATQVDELAPQFGSDRQRGLNGQFQTAVNLSVDFSRILCSD